MAYKYFEFGLEQLKPAGQEDRVGLNQASWLKEEKSLDAYLNFDISRIAQFSREI